MNKINMKISPNFHFGKNGVTVQSQSRSLFRRAGQRGGSAALATGQCTAGCVSCPVAKEKGARVKGQSALAAVPLREAHRSL